MWIKGTECRFHVQIDMTKNSKRPLVLKRPQIQSCQSLDPFYWSVEIHMVP